MIYNKNSEISCKRLLYKGHEHTEKDFRFFYGESVNLLAQPHAAAAICCYPLGKTQTNEVMLLVIMVGSCDTLQTLSKSR